MAVRNLVKVLQVQSCTVTADQWQLYASPKRDHAARALNAAFLAAVNIGCPRNTVAFSVEREMEAWADLGAMDSEAFDMLSDMLDEIFGRG